MKAKIIIGTFVVLLVMLFVSLFFNYKQYRDTKDKPKEIVKVETKTEYVERPTETPQATFEKPVGTITATVAKPAYNSQKPSQIISDNDSDLVAVYVPPDADSLTIELPKTQKVYTDDSTYTAYVSGYQPNLDSIRIRVPVITNTVTKTLAVEKAKFRRINIGLTGGYGYGIKNKQFDWFVGVGVTYSIF